MSFAPPSSVFSSNVVCHAGDNGSFTGHDCSVKNGPRHFNKPRPANINTSAAGYGQISVEDGNRDGHSLGLSSSVPSMQLGSLHFLNTPTSPSYRSSGNHMSPPQTAPLKKPSLIRSFFVCKTSRCSSNSVAPLPKSPTSPTRSSHLAHFSYTPSQFAPTDVTHNHPYPSHRSTLAPPPSYGTVRQTSSSRPSNEEDIGKSSNLPDSMITLTQIACDRDPSQLPSPISPPEQARPPLFRSSPMRLGPHNLIIPPYHQLQKKREDLKRKDTSHLPHQNVDAGQLSAAPAFHSKLGPSPTIGQNNQSNGHKNNQGEKLTVSAKYLTNHSLNSDFSQRYVVGDELGSGGFGFVVSSKRISDGKEVAVKFIHKDKVPVHGWIHDAQLGYIPMEIYVVKNFPHPAMIEYVDMYDDFKFFYLVMELHGTPWTASNPVLQSTVAEKNAVVPLPGFVSPAQRGGLVGAAAAAAAANASIGSEGRSGTTDHPAPKKKFKNPPRPGMARRTSCDLFECIEHHSKFSENKARHIFKQIVDCVRYLNEYGICHRDIKDENIVIDKDLKVKLIDFGSAVIVRPTGRLFDRFYGTINYASPEILRGEKYRAESAEIWSLGILLYTLLYGEVPFNDPQQAIYGPYVMPKVQSSRECVHLLNWMLEKKGDLRASIEEVFCHPWLHPAGDGKP